VGKVWKPEKISANGEARVRCACSALTARGASLREMSSIRRAAGMGTDRRMSIARTTAAACRVRLAVSSPIATQPFFVRQGLRDSFLKCGWLLVPQAQGRLNLCQSIATEVIVSKRNVVVLGAARSAIGTFGGSLADIDRRNWPVRS